MSKHTVEVTDANFDEVVLKSTVPVVVDFWAQWCGPCLAIAPALEELAQEFDGKLVIAKLDVDNNPEKSQAYQVRSIPYLVFFKNGQISERHVGMASKGDLKKKIESQLVHA
jgi:thioredoxin 1